MAHNMTQIRQEIEKLHNAAHEGDADTVKTLLNAGVDVNARAEHNRTPLHAAAWHGDAEVVKMFLGRGADPNAKDVSDATALHWAATCGHADVVEALLRGGADINVKDQLGETPLYQTCSKKAASMAVLLISHGADPFLTTRGKPPFAVILQMIKDGKEGSEQALQFKQVLQAVKDRYPEKCVDWWVHH